MSRFLSPVGLRLRGCVLGAAVFLSLLLSVSLRAATIEVGDETELAAAIEEAAAFDTIQFLGDITLTTEALPPVTKALTFSGSYLYGATGLRAFTISGPDAEVVLAVDVSEIDLTLANDARVSTPGDLKLGALDNLHVRISGGAQFTGGANAFFGYGAGVGGLLTVDGVGSLWSGGNQLSIGAYGGGVGEAKILNGGEIQANAGFVGAVEATGTLTVDGVGSRWKANVSKVGFFKGHGTVIVQNGGLFDGAHVEMGSTEGGSATFQVQSAGVVLAPYFGKAAGAESATIDLDGGILRASANQTNFLQGFAPGDMTLGAGGGIFDTNAFEVTVGAVIDGAGALTKRGEGTLTLTAANTYTGGTRIEGGALAIDAANKLGAAGTAITLDGGTLQTTGNYTISRPMTLEEGGGAINFTLGAQLTYTGVISGDGGLEQRGGGVLVLTGANTFTGALTVSDGALHIGNGATGSITGDLVNNSWVEINRTGTLAYAGDISGTGDLVKHLSGTATLSGALSYDGATYVYAGTLAIASPDVFAGESVTVEGGMLRFEATANSGASEITVNGGQVRFAGSASAGSSSITTNTLTFAYFLGDASAGSATITNNGLSFTSFEENATADDATIVLGPDAFVEITELTSSGIAIGSLAGEGNVHLGDKRLTVGGLNTSTTISGGIDGTGGVLEKTGTGTLTLSGENSYTGGTVVEGGTLTIAATDALGTGNVTVYDSVLRFEANAAAGARTITVNNAEVQFAETGTAEATAIVTAANGVIDLTALTAGGTSIGSISGLGLVHLGDKTLTTGARNALTEFSGVIDGAGGALVKNGSGMLTLSGANNYTGGTTVSAGALRVANASGSATGTGLVTIGAGARLRGPGTIGGSVVAQVGAITAPGDLIGTLTIDGDYTWNGSSDGTATQVFELDNAGNTSDRLAIGGAFTKGAGTSYRFDFSGTGQAGRTYTLVTFASTTFVVGDFSYENLGTDLTGTFALNGTTLTFSVVSSAPVITTTAAVTFVEDSVGVLVDAGLTVTDPDSATFASATVSITADFLAGDVLELTGVAADVDADYDADDGVLTIVPKGTAPTVARWQTLLRAVRFSNPSDALPADGSRTVTFTVSDGALTSTPASKTVLVTNRNDAPTISGGPVALTSVDENTTSSSTVISTILTAVNFDDVDPDSGAGLVVTATVGNGAWEYSTDGVTWTGVGSVSASAGLLLTGTSRLRYVPDNKNAETATLTFRAWDESSGTASTNATRRHADVAGDLATNDDASMFSEDSGGLTIDVTAVNDAPTLAGGPYAFAGTTADVASSAVTVTTLLAGVTYADVDTGALRGIAVTAATGNGNWQFSTGGPWTSFGAVAEAAALLLDGATQVRYVGDGTNAETATFMFVAWDRTTGVASSGVTRITADTTTNGGTTAFSIGTAQATITVSSLAPPDIEATITLSDLVQAYDGSPKTVRVRTTPAGLATDVTYSGNSTPPTAIGRYGVVAWITESGYTGSEMATLEITPPAPPQIVTPPAHARVGFGESARFSVVASGVGTLSYQWFKNGVAIAGATSATLDVAGVTAADIAFYDVEVSDEFGGRVTSEPATVELQFDGKLVGDGVEVLANVTHPNGNTYDQVLVTGESVSLRADPGQITRVSFIDLSDDIVQLEFSGAGVLTILIENASGPATPVNYNQPTVAYMKGHATLAIAGADASTNLMIFSVGRTNTVNQALFRDDVTYDGFADLARVMIASPSGHFGGVRSGNAAYFHASGYTGLFAPGVRFGGPAYLSEISGSDDARAVFVTGDVIDARITGGDLFQDNGGTVEVDGMEQLRFTAGQSSHGVLIPAQTNRGRLMRDGVDVTAQLVAP
jgi:autotransporter-associated beta strand protein/T5SS/PEP-CTERM-associated repeat protein